MGLFSRVSNLARRIRGEEERGLRGLSENPRSRSFESMEPRRMLAADLLQIGAVYTEADLGSDIHGDTFEITFEGGAAGTELTRLIVDGDQDSPGFGDGDVFFDQELGGFGADQPLPFTVVTFETADPNSSVLASVIDGQSLLTLDLSGFRAGDRLVFSIDVDEVEDFDPNESDLTLINDGFDPITSGVEFQGSRLTAEFSAPHYFDAAGNAEFRNRYDDALIVSGLSLPADDANGQRDRTDGAFIPVQQQPRPIAISGSVYLDHDLDLTQATDESGIDGVELSLWQLDGVSYGFTGHSASTDANGDYEFGFSLDLLPGTYQVREVQPANLFSVGAIPGSVVGHPTGSVVVGDPDRLTNIAILRGGEQAVDYDFAEAQPAAISGFVFHDRNDDGQRQSTTEEGIAGVPIDVIPVTAIRHQETVRTVTDADGFYSAVGLAPGSYRVVEVTQPGGYFDGFDEAGTVGNQRRGTAQQPGDQISGIDLFGGDAGVEFNFGEIRPASIQGRVHLSSPDGDCDVDQLVLPALEGVVVQLLDRDGQLLNETRTDANGHYEFQDLLPGEYSVLELTPTGLLDAAEHVGLVAGLPRGQISGNDRIESIVLASGEQGRGYDFCEHQPASVSGHVYHDENNNGQLDAAEERIASAVVSLIDSAGVAVASQQTDLTGSYAFAQLHAGSYSLRETQPTGWFDGIDMAGTVDGVQVGQANNPGDAIHDVQLRYGDDGVRYDFGELLPVKLGGFVYHDRNDNGIREAGEEGLAGVTLTVMPRETYAPQDAVTVVTDADGMYMTGMIAPGRYDVVETVQPGGYLDGQDAAGEVDGLPRGLAANPGDLVTDILLTSGQVGVNYNFGELLPSSISGRVHLSDSADDCIDDSANHAPLQGVELKLLNADGVEVAETTTNAAGEYRFSGLLPGTYAVVEKTPAGLLDGGERVGMVAGAAVGEVIANDTIGSIALEAGQTAVQYDFCEHQPASLSGYVYHDLNNSGTFDPGEAPIAGVTVMLVDSGGAVVDSQDTSTAGFYEFANLLAGEYHLHELQPADWNDGLDAAGLVGAVAVGSAVNPGDTIDGIRLTGGDAGVHYDFGELLPAGIAGSVHVDNNGNCVLDPGESPLAGVTIELVDSAANVVGITRTDANGNYRFADLLPGTYTVREIQPAGHFQGSQRPGSHGAQQVTQDLFTVDLQSGDQLVDYDFCEIPPARLSGFVFQDGPTLITPDGLLPANLAEVRDGSRTPDDMPINGVVLRLRNGFDGTPISSADALPGYYPDGPITTTSGLDGSYVFAGLRGNFSYAVYQVHPADFIDGIDTAGSTSGLAMNLGDPDVSGQIFRFAGLPSNDAIVLIPLGVGSNSTDNNFSEVLTEAQRTPVPPALRIAFPSAARDTFVAPLITAPATQGASIRAPAEIPLYGGGSSYTWHLSVIDGGMPRGLQSADTINVTIWRQTTFLEITRWEAESLQHAKWTLKIDAEDDTDEEERRYHSFGVPGGIPVAGDFNGDGIEEIGIFIKGEWFVDLNGNGRWDEEDLWALLGSKEDRPVTGDWDGDGKDDIGIFGPAWSNDERAVRAEPGLPDVLNAPHDKPKNPPPAAADAADGRRLLRLHLNGPRRADLIDHVFQFGAARDVPVAVDIDGDGISSIGTFRDGQWQLDVDGDGRFGRGDKAATFGAAGDVPVVGDFDGNGVDEIGVYRAGRWQIDSNRNFEMDAHDQVFEMGDAADRPVVGDWDGDGADEPGIYREAG